MDFKSVVQSIQANKSEVDENGHRLVVRNGDGKTRTVSVGSGSIEVPAPRVADRREGEKFLSSILSPHLRKSPKSESIIPLLYLKGLSLLDIEKMLSARANFLPSIRLPSDIFLYTAFQNSDGLFVKNGKGFSHWGARRLLQNGKIFHGVVISWPSVGQKPVCLTRLHRPRLYAFSL